MASERHRADSRGLDVLALSPSEHLSEGEIAAAALAGYDGVFNPQQQFRVRWPDEPVVARPDLDQLGRAEAVSDTLAAAAAEALERAEASLADGIDALADSLGAESSGGVGVRPELSGVLFGRRQTRGEARDGFARLAHRWKSR